MKFPWEEGRIKRLTTLITSLTRDRDNVELMRGPVTSCPHTIKAYGERFKAVCSKCTNVGVSGPCFLSTPGSILS